MWYLSGADRFRTERQAVQALESEVAWLHIDGWRIEASWHLLLDGEITVGERAYPITLRYGLSFPSTPPSVIPRVPERWSGHQYGAGGELCLEYGADNWHPALTGVDMLRSAERLLREEAEAGVQRDAVPSRHATTVGQDFRNVHGRLLVTGTLQEFLLDRPRGETLQIEYLALSRDKSLVVVPAKVVAPADQCWLDARVPAALECFAQNWRGLGFALPASTVGVPRFSTATEFRAHLIRLGLVPPEGYVAEDWEFILIHGGDVTELFFLTPSDQVHRFPPILPMSDERLDAAHVALAGKCVGIIGCGSVGAKIATMLARSGVRAFVLVDDDVLAPENLVRQELDWTSMGEHKVDAVARRIALVAPDATCKRRRQRLGGQEANGATDTSVTMLGGCDLIVDATANPHVFNLLAGFAQSAERTLVWVEVFGGGIGGSIARARPKSDPDPHTARAKLIAWCAQQGIAAPQSGTNYDDVGNGVPLIADDADVTVIAAHAARFCIDALLSRTPSRFPASAYFIGLASAWLFEQPFQTFPIDLGTPAAAASAPAPPDPAHIASIVELMSNGRDEPPPSP